MVMIRAFADPSYRPDYGMVVLRNAWLPEELEEPHDVDDESAEFDVEDDILDEHATPVVAAGALVLAGAGWLYADACDGPQDVRLELHDVPPPLDPTAEDVGETSFVSTRAALHLDDLINTDPDPDLLLDGPGPYRVRVSRWTVPDDAVEVPDEQADEVFDEDDDGPPVLRWLVQLWPTPQEPELPRRLRRSEPAVGTVRVASRWTEVLPGVGHLSWQFGRTAGLLTGQDDLSERLVAVDALDAGVPVLGLEPGWLDEPLWPRRPEPLPTAHADLDAQARAAHRRDVDDDRREEAELAGIARSLGVAAPTTAREAVDVLVACGLLRRGEVDGRPAVGWVREPRPVTEVLTLPEPALEQLSREDAEDRFGGLAREIVGIAIWQAAGAAGADALTVRGLADRLLVDVPTARAALAFAVESGDVGVDGDPDADDVPLTLTPTRTEPADVGHDAGTAAFEPGVVVEEEFVDADDVGVEVHDVDLSEGDIRLLFGRIERLTIEVGVVHGSVVEDDDAGEDDWDDVQVLDVPEEEPDLPRGAPPVAGLADDSGLTVFRNGRPLRLEAADDHPRRLLESVAGVVHVGYGGDPVTLLRWDGGRETLVERGEVAVSADGRFAAVLEEDGSFARPRSHVHLLDLAGGGRADMPWPERDDLGLLATTRDEVHLRSGQDHLVWRPGTDPVVVGPVPDEVDPLTGTDLTRRPGGGVEVRRPGSGPVLVELGGDVHLAPGGDRVWTVRTDRPSVTVVPVGGTVADARTTWLPKDAGSWPQEPVWETEHVVLVALRWTVHGAAVLRADTRTGRVEVASSQRYQVRPSFLVTPYLVRDAVG